MALKQSVKERFWAKVDIRGPDECWPWKSWTNGAQRRIGYGQFRGYQGIDGPIRSAHRIAYQLHCGESLKGWLVRHKCDNPLCCNPAHLSRGTHADNMRDMVARKRVAFGSRSGKTKLTEKDVRLIRLLLAEGWRHKPIAEHYGISMASLWDIKVGRNWKYLPVLQKAASRD